MRGAHRGPGGVPAWKNARWLAVLVGLVLAVPALVAGLIWALTNATDHELSVGVLILGVVELVHSLARGKLDQALSSAGVVTLFGWQVFSDVTHHPAGGLAGFAIRAVAMTCSGAGLVLATRELHLGRVWKALRAGLASGPGGDGPSSPG